MHYSLAVVDYYRHTGDSTFASSQYANFAQQLAYDETQLDSATQLIAAQPFGGFFGLGTGWDWNFYDGNKLGLSSLVQHLVLPRSHRSGISRDEPR